MGTKTTPSALTLLQVRVQPPTARRVAEAARRIDQPMAVWLRMAIIEKLDRDRDA